MKVKVFIYVSDPIFSHASDASLESMVQTWLDSIGEIDIVSVTQSSGSSVNKVTLVILYKEPLAKRDFQC